MHEPGQVGPDAEIDPMRDAGDWTKEREPEPRMNPPREPAGFDTASNELLIAVDEREGVDRRASPPGVEGWVRENQVEDVVVILETEPQR